MYFLALLIACSGSPDSKPGTDGPQTVTKEQNKSGDRIKIVSFTTEDGASYVSHLFDEEFGKSCNPMISGDGKVRCLPETKGYFQGNHSDSNCTKKVANPSGCATVTTQDFAYQSFGCVNGRNAYKVYRLTAPYSGPLYNNLSGNCVPSGNTTSDNFYLMGAEIPPSELQEIVEKISD